MKKIVVIGGGTMGLDIAQVFAKKGFDVVVRDINDDIIKASEGRLNKGLDKLVSKGKMDEAKKADILAHMTFTTDLNMAADADLVVEAAIENLDIKKSIFAELDKICKPETILATNTSSISITALSGVVTKPERFVGMHFFNPVPVMKLLEIVRGLHTAEETIAAARAVGERLGKVCIVSADSVGFIVNRLLDPMINEAFDLIERGVGTPEDIDTGCKYGLNWPMGPCELIDMAGIDILLAVMETIYADTGDSKYRPSPLLRRMVEAGRLGRKSGRGFYDYTEK